MSKPQRHPSHRLIQQAAELSLAAPQVVAHRLGRMATAGPTMSAADKQEFTLMWTEKTQAFQQGFWDAMTTSVSAPASQWHTTTHLVKVASAGLAPMHAKAVANAKRLSRLKKG